MSWTLSSRKTLKNLSIYKNVYRWGWQVKINMSRVWWKTAMLQFQISTNKFVGNTKSLYTNLRTNVVTFFFSHFINDAKIDLITFSSCIRLFTLLRSDNLIIAITWQPSSRSRGLWQNAVWSQNRFNTVKGHYKMCSDTLICPNKTYIHFQNSFFSIIKDYYENRMWIADNTNKLESIPCLNFIDIFSAPKHTVYIRSF